MDPFVILSDVRIVVRLVPVLLVIGLFIWMLLTAIWGSPRAFCAQLRLEILELFGLAPPSQPAPPPPQPPEEVVGVDAEAQTQAPRWPISLLFADDGGLAGVLAIPLLQAEGRRRAASDNITSGHREQAQAPGPIDDRLLQSLSRSEACLDVFRCPITSEVMADPVIAADGHTYERTAIERWLSQHLSSPMTNAPLPSRALLPNFTLRSQIVTAAQGAAALEAAARDRANRRAVEAADARAAAMAAGTTRPREDFAAPRAGGWGQADDADEDSGFVDVLTLPADDPSRRVVTMMPLGLG